MDLRKAIDGQIRRQGMSRYRLAQRVKGCVPASTVYGFLAGRHPMGSDALGHVIEAAGLRLVRADDDADTTGEKGGER